MIKIDLDEISEEKIIDMALEAGADDCLSNDELHEIHCEKSKIYDVKKKLEINIKNFVSTEIEWIPVNSINISKDKFNEIKEFLEILDNDEDVQNIFTNFKIVSN